MERPETAAAPDFWIDHLRAHIALAYRWMRLTRQFASRFFRKDHSGVPRPIEGALFDAAGNPGVAFVMDLTGPKRPEETGRNIRQKNRVSTVGELVTTVAHEITPPIASARNNALAALNFLDKQPPDLGEVREALRCIVGDADRAGEIIDRIGCQVKKAASQKNRIDLNEAISEVVGLARSAIAKDGVSVRTRLAEGLLPVHGDRVQLQQVILNLILNAAEAMSAADEGARELLISTARRQTNDVLVAVNDSGPGIDRNVLERVFEAFYTTKVGRLGMGLSVCRSIIAAHGGRLWAEAKAPRGAVLQFTLPSAEGGS